MKKIKDKTYNKLTPSIHTVYIFLLSHNLFFYRERLYWYNWITFPSKKKLKKVTIFFLNFDQNLPTWEKKSTNFGENCQNEQICHFKLGIIEILHL